MQNFTLLNALKGTNEAPPPLWLMRQAGRYIPDYQRLKEQHSLKKMFGNPELIVKTTLLPIPLLGVDAAILFADIMSVIEGWGLEWEVVDGVGPLVTTPVSNYLSLSAREPDLAYRHIGEAIKELKKVLPCPLIGFAGAPFTVASFLIEGKISRDLGAVKKRIYSDPPSLHRLLQKLTELTISYLDLQIRSGVDVVQIFDSLAHQLSLSAFQKFSLPYLKQIVSHVKAKKVPLILFCRGSSSFLPDIIQLNPTAISLDWQCDITTPIPSHIAFQGNLDPHLLFGSREIIKEEVEALFDKVGTSARYIFNLGHGILPGTPLENVRYLVECVRDASLTCKIS